MAGHVQGIVAVGIVETAVGGSASVGGGWSSLTAWLVAAAAITVLAGAAWWIAGPSRWRSRRGSAGAEVRPGVDQRRPPFDKVHPGVTPLEGFSR